jgi:hypothetical protein
MFKATAITAALSVMLAVAIEETPPAPEATDEVPGPDPSLRGKGGGHGGHDRHWGDWFPNGNVTHFCKTGMTNEGFDVCCNATCIDTSITDKKNPRYGYQCGGKGCSDRFGGADDCCIEDIERTHKICKHESELRCIMPMTCQEDRCLLHCPMDPACGTPCQKVNLHVRLEQHQEGGKCLRRLSSPLKAPVPT